MRLGIFGGTFDPPHLGHLVVAQEIHTQLELDTVLMLPAAVPPHKRERDVSPPAVRLEMLEAAIGDDPRLAASDLELRRSGPSYTVDTLRELADRHPGARLFLAIGADQLAVLDTWKDPDGIAGLATLAAFARSGQPVPEELPWPYEAVEVPSLEISSTDIRRRVAAGLPIRYLVPAPVEAIIRRESLYLDPPAP